MLSSILISVFPAPPFEGLEFSLSFMFFFCIIVYNSLKTEKLSPIMGVSIILPMGKVKPKCPLSQKIATSFLFQGIISLQEAVHFYIINLHDGRKDTIINALDPT